MSKLRYIIHIITNDKQSGFYTGNSFDTDYHKAKRYDSRKVSDNIVKKLKKETGLKSIDTIAYWDTGTKKKRVVKKRTKHNPIKRKRKGFKPKTYKVDMSKYHNKATRINAGVYLYKGFVIEKMGRDKWFFKAINTDEWTDAQNTLSDAKLFIDNNYGFDGNKNPIRGSKKRRIKKAQNLFENFTGHPADSFEIVQLPQDDTGLKIGRCLGIMYETTRDGKKESYLHEFKKTSQPDFCVSASGQQIYLIGGNYLFKDSGINDI